MALGLAGKPSHTLLLLTPRLIARMDFKGSRSPRLVQAWSVPTSDRMDPSLPIAGVQPTLSTSCSASLQGLVERAMQLGPTKHGKLSVLSTCFWSDVVMLQADVAAMATPSELNQSLAIEAELDSQLSPFETQPAILPLDSDTDQYRSYLVTLVANSQINELQRFSASKDVSLFRLAHPLALSRSEELCNRQAAIRQIEWWREVATGKQQLLETSDSLDLEKIAESFIQSLTRSPSPLWVCPVSEPSLRKQLSMAAFCGIAAALGCFGHYSHIHWRWEFQKQRFAELSEFQAEYDAKTVEVNDLQKQLVKARTEEKAARDTTNADQERMQLAARQKRLAVERWGQLLNTLSSVSHECWIRRIDSDRQATRLHGIALDISQAHTLAARLEVALQRNGWQVSPATTSTTPQGLVEFSIALLPVASDLPKGDSNRSIVFKVYHRSENPDRIDRETGGVN